MSVVLAPDAVVGDHRLEERLGEGGFGEVWRARRIPGATPPSDPDEPEVVAIKVARDPARARSLAREAALLERLRHPGIVRTYRVRPHDDPPHLVMQLIEGRNLRALIDSRERSRVGWRTAVPIARAIAEALAVAHARGIVHGDIKPENVLITPDGDVVLTDFGLGHDLGGAEASLAATLASFGALAPGKIAGTLAYMAPECRRGERAAPAADIYSLGVLLFEMLVGSTPRGAWRPLVERGVESWPALDALLRRLLDSMAGRRPGAASDVAERLGRLEGGPEASAGELESPRRCPQDGALLHRAVSGGCVLDRCRRCGGTWFDAGELEEVARELTGEPHRIAQAQLDDTSPAGRCPVCGRQLGGAHLVLEPRGPSERAALSVEGAARCRRDGVWLPAAARRALVRAVGASASGEVAAVAPTPTPAPAAPPSSSPSRERERGREEAARWAKGREVGRETAAIPRELAREIRQQLSESAVREDDPVGKLDEIERLLRSIPGLGCRRSVGGALLIDRHEIGPARVALIAGTVVVAPCLLSGALGLVVRSGVHGFSGTGVCFGLAVGVFMVLYEATRVEDPFTIMTDGRVRSRRSGKQELSRLRSIRIGTWPPRARTRSDLGRCTVKLFLRWQDRRVDRIQLGDPVDRSALRLRLRKAGEIAEALADLAGPHVSIVT